MNLTTLTHRDALCLNARFTSREEAIHALTQRLAALGKISSTEQFLEEVYRRESLGPTALGEGLAVPHGKTAAVKEAKGRFVHAGYGMNALFGLQKQANSIYCRDDVDTGKRSASGNFAFIFTLKPRICGFIFNKIITLGELIII